MNPQGSASAKNARSVGESRVASHPNTAALGMSCARAPLRRLAERVRDHILHGRIPSP